MEISNFALVSWKILSFVEYFYSRKRPVGPVELHVDARATHARRTRDAHEMLASCAWNMRVERPRSFQINCLVVAVFEVKILT